MNKQQHLMTKILQKIGVFQGLSVEQAALLIQICKSRSIEANTQVYEAGEPSVDMLVLVQGKMKVLSRAGVQLAEVDPGASMGEMGVFTGQPRAATVATVDKSMALVLDRAMLMKLLNREPIIKAQVLENVVSLLASRLAATDEELSALKAQAEGE